MNLWVCSLYPYHLTKFSVLFYIHTFQFSSFWMYVRTAWRSLCITGGVSIAVPYALLSSCLSSSTLGRCKSPHKVFIRLNLGTLLPLAFELVNTDQGKRKRKEGLINGLPHLLEGACLFIRFGKSRVPPCGQLSLLSEQQFWHSSQYFIWNIPFGSLKIIPWLFYLAAS